jgi:hypothetical protein
VAQKIEMRTPAKNSNRKTRLFFLLLNIGIPVLINPLKKQPFDEITNFYDQPFATHHHGEILL